MVIPMFTNNPETSETLLGLRLLFPFSPCGSVIFLVKASVGVQLEGFWGASLDLVAVQFVFENDFWSPTAWLRIRNHHFLAKCPSLSLAFLSVRSYFLPSELIILQLIHWTNENLLCARNYKRAKEVTSGQIAQNPCPSVLTFVGEHQW